MKANVIKEMNISIIKDKQMHYVDQRISHQEESQWFKWNKFQIDSFFNGSKWNFWFFSFSFSKHHLSFQEPNQYCSHQEKEENF